MTDEKYCYPPDYTVLRNKADIQDQAALQQFERRRTAIQMRFCPQDTPLTYDGYKAIHQHIFQDVYDWAGQSRTVEIAKGFWFEGWKLVDEKMQERFDVIQSDDRLKSKDPKVFSARAAEHICVINDCHPFREGNGRTQRLFLRNLAHQNGHDLSIKNIDQKEWMRGSISGFRHDSYDRMEKCIAGAIIDPAHSQQKADEKKRHTEKLLADYDDLADAYEDAYSSSYDDSNDDGHNSSR